MNELESFKQQIAEIEETARHATESAQDTQELRELEAQYIRNGLNAQMKRLGDFKVPEDKREAGKTVNDAKTALTALLEQRGEQIRQRELIAQFEAERIDVTMPGRRVQSGLEHILQQTTDKIKRTLGGLGFEYRESPELELFKYNFEALNYPPDHPAMDDQDTFYLDADHLLRTQCTAMQGRVFETVQPPLRMFTVGRTYRNEAVDRTHGHTFHQVDCFMIDEGVSMAHLKGTLGLFARAMFGDDVKIRFRPDFFPFVEPGVDYAISTPKLKGGQWVELGGAGLIHPNILERYGIDTRRFSGFAFGLGVERIPMMAYGVDDLRHFLENDLRFLEQFRQLA